MWGGCELLVAGYWLLVAGIETRTIRQVQGQTRTDPPAGGELND